MRKTLMIALAAMAAFSLAPWSQAADKTLTIYTYESFTADWGPGPKVKTAFEAQCACTVHFVSLADGVALLTRLKMEGEKTKADIVLGLDNSLVTEAEATGLFEASGIDITAVKVPGGFSDPVFIPYDYGHFAVIYDSKVIKTPPASLKELVEGNPDEKIVLEDPRSSTPGLGFLIWVKAVYGDKAPEAWGKLKGRVLTVTPGWSEAYGLFTKGEAPMVVSYATSPAYHLIAENEGRYKAAEFSEGHPLQIEVAGMTKTAKDKDLARQFLSFMISPDFQNIIPESNWMMPAAPTSTPLNPVFGQLIAPKTIAIAPDEVSKNRKAWIDEWLSAMSGN